MFEIYKGEEINKSKIETLKSIAYQRYTKEIYNEYFSSIDGIKDLAHLHDVSINTENLAIGIDWFLYCTESDYHI